MYQSPSRPDSYQEGTAWTYLRELDNMARWLCEGDEASEALDLATSSMDTFRGTEMVRRWVHTLTTFEAHCHFGVSKYAEVLDDLVTGRTGRIPRGPGFDSEVWYRIEVLDRLCGLPDNYRCALLLKEGHGLSVDRVAAVMGLTVASVRSILYRARQSLRAG